MRKLISLMLLMMVIVVGCKKDDPVISEYIVTFNTQGGSNIDALKVVEGQKVTKPQDPTKENYIFSGWYKEAACTTVWDFEKETVISNVTLYAKWVEAAQACVVTFDTQGGSEVAPLIVNKGERLMKPTDPTKEDYSFLGWYKDAACTDAWEFSTDIVNGDITLYARWSNPGETVYTVTFDTDGGNEMEPASVKANEKVIKPVNPVKTDFEFRGWYSDTDRQIVYDFESPVTADITLYAKWVKAEISLVDFNISDLSTKGVKWDAETRVLDITSATGNATLYFSVAGISTIESKVTAEYDTYAKSIGGEDKLNDILVTGAVVDGKTGMEIKTPVQNPNLRVPLDINVTIGEVGTNKSEIITIQSRPNYANTNIKPVRMKTQKGKTVFWAPINVGATKMPESVPNTANTDITESCGKLFQWGRKSGLKATNNSIILQADTIDVRNLGFPTGQNDLSNMSKWDGKFIYASESDPDTQYYWLLFEKGKNNPEVWDRNAWYQKLWNNGTEAAPVKTEFDPCPEGWRVPTRTEWNAITTTVNWDVENKILTIAGAESGQMLILPGAGNRAALTGISRDQSVKGYYWTSSTHSTNMSAYNINFNSNKVGTGMDRRSNAYSVRCIQE